MSKTKLQVNFTPSLRKVRFGTYIGKIDNYQKAIMEFGSFTQKSQHGVPFSCDKVDNPKFFFNYMKLGTSDYVKNVFIQRMLEYNDDKYKVIVHVDDPNNNPKALVGNLCDT